MLKFLFSTLIILLGYLCCSVRGMGIDLSEDEPSNYLDVGEERFFPFPVIMAGGNGFNFNNSMVIAGLAALGGLLGILPLLGLGGLLAGLLLNYDDRGAYSDSGYRSYRTLSDNLIDWERFSLIDWVSIGEETFRKFDPSDLDCQKRFVCEVHQNAKKFGYVAEKIIDFVSYFQYLKAFGLPDQLLKFMDEYLDAAERGKSMKKECGLLYSDCQFSVKEIIDRVSINEI